MLLWERTKNLFAQAGLARAAAELSRQGYHDSAKTLMIERSKLSAHRLEAIKRLERKRKLMSDYEPGDHYMRGKTVATWKGKAHA
tara:strand:+ start:1210 stop:1464 length:255 start_codon:yes stop_codon:yes gene_type:complete